MLEKWFLMQCIKGGSTLRISPKKDKPSPRVVYREGKQDEEIESFLARRKLIKNLVKCLLEYPVMVVEKSSVKSGI